MSVEVVKEVELYETLYDQAIQVKLNTPTCWLRGSEALGTLRKEDGSSGMITATCS
jgi:hypothetical protein